MVFTLFPSVEGILRTLPVLPMNAQSTKYTLPTKSACYKVGLNLAPEKLVFRKVPTIDSEEWCTP